MNSLLHIRKDDEIVDIELATEEEIEGFSVGSVDDPELDPMRPYLEGKVANDWNEFLCELFIKHFAKETGWKMNKAQEKGVEEMFDDRLKRLARKVRNHQNLEPDQLLTRKKRNAKCARRNSRRNTVCCSFL
jgi:hypothetical protein